MTDWSRWHENYYDRGRSGGQQRLVTVQRHIGSFLESRPVGAVRIVDACSGQGRDLLPVLAEKRDRPNVWARLIERDHRNASAARRLIDQTGLRQIEVVEADAGCTDAYVGAVPADLILICGVFGHLSEADIQATVSGLSQLCAEGATIIWTRSRFGGDLTPSIRRWFADEGFGEQAFDSPRVYEDDWAVGVHRLNKPPQEFKPAQRLFTFID